jgi:hypothetical protein
MAAISAVNSAGDAQSELVRYQQKLAADLAAKAAAKVIADDQDTVARAEQSVQRSQQNQQTQQAQQAQAQPPLHRSTAPIGTPTTETAGAVGSTLDVTV